MARGATGLVMLFALAELVTRLELVDPIYLPPASTVLVATVSLLLDLEFLGHVGATLAAWAIGLGIATAIAVPLGVVLGSSWRGYLASSAAIEFLRPIPSVALIPLAILLLGRGLDMKVLLVAYASVWPILFNTIYGVREVDPLARDTGRAFGLGRVTVLWRIALPAASPFIATGVRVSAAIALILAISSELIAGGTQGLGVWMLANSQAGVPRELLYAGIVVAGLLGLALNALLAAGERRLFAWHPRVRGAA
ncbi:MAG: ABC transporter permease [Candidatus Limnocylindria bacterium]